MKKLMALFLASVIIFTLVGCGKNKIIYPYVQEYIAGQGNIKGDIQVEKYSSVSEDFAIGANKDGYAVFKNPKKAFIKLQEFYSDGIKLIQTEFDLKPLTENKYNDYKIYGWQVTSGTAEQRKQAIFVSSFLDIYENSYIKQ